MQENRQEKSQIKQKILLYLSKKGISAYEFYKSSGVTRGILTQNNGINEDNIARFLAYAPDVNVEWLLTGRGEILKTKETPSDTPADQQLTSCSKDTNNNTIKQEKQDEKTPLVTQLLDTIKEQAEEIGRLKARIDELERRRGDNAGDAPTSDIAHVG